MNHITDSNHEKPRWVLIDKVLHNASDYAHIPPHDRPQASCPACGKNVIMKLGDIKAHHYAHDPGDDYRSECTATAPETALHLNAKFHVYSQLLSAHQLTIVQTCKDGYCKQQKELVWAEKWTRANVEYTIHPIRPDIVLHFDNKPSVAIEIFASHTVSKTKSIQYKQMGMDWIEVAASEKVLTWHAGDPLSVRRQGKDWICEICKSKSTIAKAESPKPYEKPSAICAICREDTSDWWFHDPTTNTCKCRPCAQQGKY